MGNGSWAAGHNIACGAQGLPGPVSSPSGLAVDASGNLFIADATLNVVSELEVGAGTFRVVAGQAYARGYTGDGGAATSATLSEPRSVAVDGAGNLYIADSDQNVIRNVNGSTGIISTVLGGTATALQLNNPSELSLDSSSHLYVADTGNNIVRQFDTQTGTSIIVAGTGLPAYGGDVSAAVSAQLNGPESVAVDSSGNVYIADTQNNLVRMVNGSGVISTVAGNYTLTSTGMPPSDGGPATGMARNGPRALAVDAGGNLYIADLQFVRRVNAASQTMVTIAGSALSSNYSASLSGSVATSIQISPVGIALAADGSLYISDFGDDPNSKSGTLSGSSVFRGWALDDYTSIETVQIAVDGAPLGNAHYGDNRTDVCQVYPAKTGCPNVGWSYSLDTTLLTDGTHELFISATNSAGQSTTETSFFQVANRSGSPINLYIDSRGPQIGILAGTVNLAGWAIGSQDSIGTVIVLIDGVSVGNAAYGSARPDVCFVYPGRAGCPNVGWKLPVDTTLLANGTHTAEVRATATGGVSATIGATFTVAN